MKLHVTSSAIEISSTAPPHASVSGKLTQRPFSCFFAKVKIDGHRLPELQSAVLNGEILPIGLMARYSEVFEPLSAKCIVLRRSGVGLAPFPMIYNKTWRR
jgi:hypothetical protein